MATLKCKMCGGTIEFEAGSTVGVCDSCGTKQTLPKTNDEVISNLFNRANNLRLKCEFDKAAQIYEKIVEQDDSEAEAHWGIVLCKYGIEYVEDPKTFKRIPTCHRTLFEAVTTDTDYLAAIDYSDALQQQIYESEARAIDKIQKDILAIVKNEKPFDVFICYKETDDSGKRTIDSTIANDIYYQLTQEGFKVFFAAITLEDKLGQEYEPYIFAALNSAKVMLVLGTKPEYFSAVWVKNEWSRFLQLMKTDRSKLLIPCYRDMDAYDLPEEFAHLQAQDMGKIGFINDVVRGIKKVAQADAPKPTVMKETVVAAGNANTAPLLERAFMFLEDGDWASADEYCEKVLDLDPKNARAYLGKLMAELRVRKQESLTDQAEPFDNSSNYQKAIRFADEKLKTALAGYIEHINTRNENARLDGIYTRAKNAMSAANTESTYKEAAHLFETISEYQDSAVLAQSCYEKAEVARKDALLSEGKAKMTGEIISNYESAIKLFKSISGWKDADEKICACQRKIEEIKAKEEAERLEKERQAEIDRKEAEARAKKGKRITIVLLSIFVAAIAFIIVLCEVIIPNGKYNDAIALMDAGKYTEAISAFEALDGYKDSTNKISECNYLNAIALMDAGKYTEAISAFEALDGYKDSATKITECNTAILDGKYNDAIALMDAGKYTEAISAFEALDGYKDSVNKIEECNINIYGEEVWNKVKSVNVGDVFKLGLYEQDNNKSNGQEDIEWLVLAKDGTKILVISKYALDCKPYNTSYTNVTWETCTLRKWLNNDFLGAAFSADEQTMIPTITVTADENPAYSTNPGNATQDQVFLLSITEANKYFSSDSARQCEPTDFAVANGVWESDSGNCAWWLRSPGYNLRYAAYVHAGGRGEQLGLGVGYDDYAVRPAMWIDLSKV